MNVREKLAELLAGAPYNLYGDRIGVLSRALRWPRAISWRGA